MAKFKSFCPRCGSINSSFGLPLGKFKYAVGVELSYSCKACGYSQINRFPEATAAQLKRIKATLKKKAAQKNIDRIPTLPYEYFKKYRWYRIISGIILVLFAFFIVLVILVMVGLS
jgi:hypothetical protein